MLNQDQIAYLEQRLNKTIDPDSEYCTHGNIDDETGWEPIPDQVMEECLAECCA